MADLVKDSKTIADIVRATDTDIRGVLLRLVAERLELHTQYFTSKLFREIATTYGEPERWGGSK